MIRLNLRVICFRVSNQLKLPKSLNRDCSNITDYGISRGSPNRNQLGRNTPSASVFPWSSYRDLSKFFITPKLKFAIAEADKETWKRTYPVTRIGYAVPQPTEKARILTITVGNRGRGVAEDSRAFASFVEPLTLRRFLRETFQLSIVLKPFHTLGWKKEFNEIEVKDYDLSVGVAKFFPREIDILPLLGQSICVLFTIEGRDEACLTSEERVPIKIPSVTDIIIGVAGSNFARKYAGRYRIILRSPEDIRMFKVTALTRLSDFLRKAKKGFNL